MRGKWVIQTVAAALSLVFTVMPTFASCTDTIRASTPSSDFTPHGNGTVTHETTGLMWMRCSLGQEWEGSGCSGLAKPYYFSLALRTAQEHDFAGYGDWRVPNKNELESIVEERCHTPSINSVIFPDTNSTYFVSSSPHNMNSTYNWTVDFTDGTVGRSFVSGRLRLVRSAELP